MKTKQVSLGPRTLNVVDKGTGHPILLVHGFPLDHQMWRFQFELSKQFRIIAPDLAGFGASPKGDDPLSMKSFADDLAALLDALNVAQPVVFCGLSMGGYVGWQFWKHHRDRLSHLVACDTRAAGDTDQVARARRVAANGVRKNGSLPVADAMMEKLFYQPNMPTNRHFVEPVHRTIAATNPESIAQAQLAMAARPSVIDWLPEINLPTLFVVGEHDGITPPEEVRSNADMVRGSKFLKISDAGHMSPLENPEMFNRELAAFLESD